VKNRADSQLESVESVDFIVTGYRAVSCAFGNVVFSAVNDDSPRYSHRAALDIHKHTNNFIIIVIVSLLLEDLLHRAQQQT